jgi:preprotein translocase subunit SecA
LCCTAAQVLFFEEGSYAPLPRGVVVYTMASNIIFSYLRDQAADHPDSIILPKPLYYIILDEADQVLVDQANQTNMINSTAAQFDERQKKRIGASSVIGKQICEAQLAVRFHFHHA